MNNNNYIVIMAGGVGSRFWPMSTEEKPKQFLDVLGIGKTLLQQTVARFKTIAPAENILIVTSSKYKELVIAQCPELLESNILLEPCMRNTAPCIAYAAYKIKGVNPEANMVVAPSDHLITNEAEFIRIIENGLEFTANNDTLLTLGIQPHRPETGYGYIQAASPLINNEKLTINNKKGVAQIGSKGESCETMQNMAPNFSPSGETERGISELVLGNFPPSGGTEGGTLGRGISTEGGFCKVLAFKEKPNLETAKEYLAAGNYFWNSGIFLWSLKSILSAFESFVPEVAGIFQKGEAVYNTDKEQAFIDELFPTCTNISIDYAVMEKADNIYVQPADFGWSDLGTWGSLWEKRERCEHGNTVVGEKVHVFDSGNCIVNMPKDKKVVIQGLQDFIVVEDNDVLLICKMEEEQRIKEFRTAVLGA
ncbi:mannose-1-phosphate guanylyltransferase [Labilibaculum sp. K2S]|uniref:mannose-1-phosphate guanylyltransferase n=1 Tax=Labilibaculum sp. K2S TaxID=3056386 RepID=UPI0025A4B2D5|nr:mannose-1-phosphate guanylyltransferase [Labilibaculum sp. K2S]MDM8160299.1 mannose-1-phosphate guanylyltransferase [Labilibaculum sp. K2S]